MNILPLVRGECPICQKVIMNREKSAYINGGMEFNVEFSDGSKANFAICSECFDGLTQEQNDEIMKRQIVSWGIEIQQQLLWYAQKAVHLKITKWKRD